jgi:hypothetical protein
MPYLLCFDREPGPNEVNEGSLFLSAYLGINDKIQWTVEITEAYLFTDDQEDDAWQIRSDLLNRKRSHPREILLRENEISILYIESLESFIEEAPF